MSWHAPENGMMLGKFSTLLLAVDSTGAIKMTATQSGGRYDCIFSSDLQRH